MQTNRNMIVQSLLLFVSCLLALTVAIPRIDSEASPNAWWQPKETVTLQIYYESLCPDCIQEYSQIPPLVTKLGDQLNLKTYPYGNAKMHVDKYGRTVVKCQHGEPECYGNKLHACAIDQLQTPAAYIPYIACMMQRRSNDTAADECGRLYNVNSESIKQCAKGQRGLDLLVYYGQESQKVGYKGVPYVLVNGQQKPEDQTLMAAVCGAFQNPPDVCNEIPPSGKWFAK